MGYCSTTDIIAYLLVHLEACRVLLIIDLFIKVGNYTLNTPNFIEIANNAML